MLTQLNRPLQRILGVLLMVPSFAVAASSVHYPTKPIRFIVTFAPGGGTDVFARALAQKFTESWGQPVIVDNRAGGNGNIGTGAVVIKAAGARMD